MNDDPSFGGAGCASLLRRFLLSLWAALALLALAGAAWGQEPYYAAVYDHLIPNTATAHKADFPYPWLPVERVCALAYQQCERDVRALTARRDVAGAWHTGEVRAALREAERLRRAWYSAWWVSDPKTTPEQRAEWTGRLVDEIGFDAFWRAEIPLPLGWE